VDTLCRDLQYLTDNGRGPQVKAYQVKAKFTQLRFYAGGGIRVDLNYIMVLIYKDKIGLG